MFIRKGDELTDLAQAFLCPASPTQRQYEALRAYFVEGISGAEAAGRFGYTEGSFRVLVHQFRQNPGREFFVRTRERVASAEEKKKDPIREQVIALRKQNLSVYDIRDALKKEGIARSAVTVGAMLKEEGFARLPRRRDDERRGRRWYPPAVPYARCWR